MCGIAGLVARHPAPDALERMLRAQAHRGPDDSGSQWMTAGEGWHVGVGTRRLAVIDLTPAGHQPMQAGNDVMVYNAETYNFMELRAELEAAGVPLRSRTDTEVVLQLLHRGGPSQLRRLNGMFGLAIWRGDERELLLARDRFGIKPLYVWTGPDGSLAFASELKALLAGGVPAELDPEPLAAYLAFGYVPGEDTMIRDVRQLPAGHMLRWRRGVVTIEPFRDRHPLPDRGLTEVDAAMELRERLRDAVRRQRIADVPVGILLSGGLDSSAILALTASESASPVHAYTIGFREEDARTEQNPDDARYAREVARHFGATLHEFEVEPEIVDLLPRVAWHLDQPLGDPAAILTLIISEAARSECTVLLSGQGADELFGGYRGHLYDRFGEPLSRVPDPVLRVIERGFDALPGLAARGMPRAGLLLAANRAGHTILDHLDLPRDRRYVAMRSAQNFQPDAIAALLAPGLAGGDGDRAWRTHLDAFDVPGARSFLDRVLHVDLATFLEGQNLVYSDRLSMAASIEMRVPYLDDVVADFALGLPARLKIRGIRGKHLLRRAMDGVVPHGVIRRRKAGFGAPIRRWMRIELRDMLREHLGPPAVTRRGLLRPATVARLVDEHESGERDHTYRLWTLLGLELWCRAYLDADSPAAAAAAP
jgi:asparagine synthase (glutamine-hydrolysing)